jgi:hypothetical protein
MAVKIEQGATISITDAIKIENGLSVFGSSCYVGQTIYSASGYDYPNTFELTTNNVFYSGLVDTVGVDVFSLSEDGHNYGYLIPFQGYYCFGAVVNFFECPFAQHYRAIIRRYNSTGSIIKDYEIGRIIAPVTFFADANGIQDLPLTITGFHADSLNAEDSLLLLVKRSDWFIEQYNANIANSAYEYEANNNTKASFNFSVTVSVLNPRPLPV